MKNIAKVFLLTLVLVLALGTLNAWSGSNNVTIRVGYFPNITHAQALVAKGDIDAALVPEPWGSRMVKEAGASIVLDENAIWRNGNYATAVVIVSEKFLKQYPDIVEKWLKAHVEVTERINRDKESAKKIVNAQLKKLTKKNLPDDVLAKSFARIKITYDPQSDSIKDFVKISLDNGYLKGKAEIKGLFDLRILNKVLKEKGLKPVK